MSEALVIGSLPSFSKLMLAQATTPPLPGGGAAGGGGAAAPAGGGGAGPGGAVVEPARPATPVAGGAGEGATGQATTTAPGGPEPGKANNQGGLGATLMQLAPIILMFVLLYFIMFRGQRKEEKRRKQLISELKKGDRVMTIGGLIARVVSIDGDEVVLKIDESANVKATYRRSAIQDVISADEKK